MFEFTIFCYHLDLTDAMSGRFQPAFTLGGNDRKLLLQIGTAFLGKSIFTDSVENACFIIYDKYGNHVDDWGHGRPAPKMCVEVQERLEKKAGFKFF